jgi:hypothetical protein
VGFKKGEKCLVGANNFKITVMKRNHIGQNVKTFRPVLFYIQDNFLLCSYINN